jgi:cephalosporin-C deacetylase
MIDGDMTLEELKNYKGITPCPPDFNNYWDRQLSMVKDYKASYELTFLPEMSSKMMQCYDLTFESFDGSMIYAKYLRPTGNEKKPLVFQFHGYPGSSRSFLELSGFVASDMSVVSMDCRGQGGRSHDKSSYPGTTVSGHIIMGLAGETPDDLYYRKVFLDTVVLVNLMKTIPETDQEKLYSNGASQGAALALVCAALNKDIKRICALYPFLSDYKRVWDLNLDLIAYEGLRYYNKWFDPSGIKVDKTFEKLGYIDVKNFAPRIQGAVLMGTGLLDDICPPSTQFAVFSGLKCYKEHILYPNFSHELIRDFDDRIVNFLRT